jgi:antitoxin ParD1/3/4
VLVNIMDGARTITITLDADTADAMEAAVRSGRHTSIEDAARAAIDGWWGDAEEVRRLVQEGADSGPSLGAETVFAELRAKYGPR